MKTILIPLAPLLLVAWPACLAPTAELTEEPVVETSAAAVSSLDDPTHTLTLDTAHAQRALPTWNAYLLGPDLHKSDSGRMVYYDVPRDSDLDARVIAVRAGDEQRPERWIDLRLEMFRYLGPAYFEKMIASGKLTLLDLVVIAGVLENYKVTGTEPPLISSIRSPAPRNKVGRESEPLPLFPGVGDLGDDHRGPAGPLGPSWPSGPPAPHPYPNGNIPGAGGPPGPRGVSYGPPPPGTETGQCDGKPCSGLDRWKGIEWKAVPVTEKWSDKFGKFFDSKRAAISASLRHALFNDGKNPGCSEQCNYLSGVAMSSMATGIMLICVAATDGVGTGPCMSGMTGAVAGGTAGLSSGTYGYWVAHYCSEHVCTEK